MLELHIHGSLAVMQATLHTLGKLENLSFAQPGEFCHRAFDNGKLDLTEVEGLADLINAETEAQRKQALRQMNGELSRLYTAWREELIKCLAYYEAAIDFGEDEQIDETIVQSVIGRVESLLSRITTHLNDGHRGERLRDGLRVAIVGPANAGKSSFFNVLAHREASIVSPIPGTTRDIIEVALNIGGYPVIVHDTAGIRSSMDFVEQEGIKRAKQSFESADLRLCINDASQYPYTNNPLLSELIENSSCRSSETMMLLNKVDLLSSALNPSELRMDPLFCNRFASIVQKYPWWPISCKTGFGIEAFMKDFQEVVRKCFECSSSAETMVITRARHREQVVECQKALQNFLGFFFE